MRVLFRSHLKKPFDVTLNFAPKAHPPVAEFQGLNCCGNEMLNQVQHDDIHF
jgi:hypothetical protein